MAKLSVMLYLAFIQSLHPRPARNSIRGNAVSPALVLRPVMGPLHLLSHHYLLPAAFDIHGYDYV